MALAMYRGDPGSKLSPLNDSKTFFSSSESSNLRTTRSNLPNLSVSDVLRAKFSTDILSLVDSPAPSLRATTLKRSIGLSNSCEIMKGVSAAENLSWKSS